MKKCEIYTDGSCLGNPGVGGWAFIITYKGHEKRCAGACEATTNNQMELRAIIEALKALKEPCEIALYTDSNLMVRSINEWLDGWVKKDFKGRKNVPLWREYLAAAKCHKIEAFWVKAHANHPQNELCDKMAREAAQNLKNELESGNLSLNLL